MEKKNRWKDVLNRKEIQEKIVNDWQLTINKIPISLKAGELNTADTAAKSYSFDDP